MCSSRVFPGSGPAAAILSLFLTAAPSVAAPSTVLGTIIGVSPETRTILLRSRSSEREPAVRRFATSDSTKIRVNGGAARFADVVVGPLARITYVRMNGTDVAELVEVLDAVVPASSRIDVPRDATGLEERRRYLEGVASTLDVLDESVQELARYPELEGTRELARRKAIVEELVEMLAKSRELLASLSATSSQEAWRTGVDEMEAALDGLRAAHARGRTEITRR